MSGPVADRPDGDAPDRPVAAGPVTHLVVAAVVVALGLAALVAAVRLGVGRPSAPGPGTWPLLVSAALVALGAALGLRARRADDAERVTRSGFLVLAAVGTMVVFVALIGSIGFEIPTVALALVWLRLLGGESWRVSILTSLAAVAAFYALFVGVLDVTVPHMF